MITKVAEEPVKDIMETDFPTLKPKDPVERALELFKQKDIRTIAVVNKEEEVIGEVDKRALLKITINPETLSEQEITNDRLLGISFMPKTVEEVMEKHLIELKTTDTISHAAKVMYRESATVLPVVDKNKIVGVVYEEGILNKVREQTAKA